MTSPIQRISALFLPLAIAAAAPAHAAQDDRGAPPAPVLEDAVRPAYADLVDQVLASPVVAVATIRQAARIKGAEAAGVASGLTRYYVSADVTALLRGIGGLSPRIGYLTDVAPGPDGRLPRLKDLQVLLFARRVPGSPDQLQLVGADGQRDWSPAAEQRTRAVVQALAAPDAPPAITGIGNAFHVPGALPGVGETQIFLTTADGRPVSLSVVRRPGERPRWSVSLSEIVDDQAAAPARDTLLWYRLACALPPALPDRSTASLSPVDADVAREDYRFVLTSLGPCGRTAAAAG